MYKNQNRIRFTVEGALIAAAYIGLTLISNLLNLAYGPIQLRFSEALTILPVFSAAAVPGLAIGCFFSNLLSTLGPIDMVFGTAATLAAALLSRMFRNIIFKNIPVVSILSPVAVNAIAIGVEINLFFLPDGASFFGFAISALTVGAGELVTCVLLGLPLYFTVKKHHIFAKNDFNKENL